MKIIDKCGLWGILPMVVVPVMSWLLTGHLMFGVPVVGTGRKIVAEPIPVVQMVPASERRPDLVLGRSDGSAWYSEDYDQVQRRAYLRKTSRWGYNPRA